MDTLGLGTDLTINSALNWTGTATINGGGTGGLVNLGTVTQSGAGQTFTMSGLAVNNQGSWVVDGTVNNAIRLNSGTQFLNAGNFTLNSTAGITDTSAGATERFDNTGVFTLNSGANTIISNLAFNNTTSTLNIQSGNLQLNGGGAFIGVITQPGAAVNLNSGSYLISSGSSFVTNNALTLSGSTVNIQSTLALDTLTLSGGTLNVDTLGLGTDLTINSALNWTGTATINGGGTGGLVNLGTVTQSGAGQTFTMSGLAVNNQGSWVVDGTVNNAIRLNSGTQFLNAGNFTLNSTAGITDTSAGATERFDNTGVFTLNSGANTIISNLAFNNIAGTVSIESVASALSLNGSPLTLGGGVLTGNGSLTGNVFADTGSSIAPGIAGPGTLSINGDVTFDSGSSYVVEFDGTGADALIVTGFVDISNGAALSVIGFAGYDGVLNDSFSAITSTSTLTGSFDSIIQDLNFSVTPAYTSLAPGDLTLAVTGLTNFWTLAGNGNWEIAGNWSRNVVPTLGHDVIVDNGPLTVSYNTVGTSPDSTINTLTGGLSSNLSLVAGSELTAADINMLGGLSLDNATLTVNGNLIADTVSASNSSLLKGTGDFDAVTSLMLVNSTVDGWFEVVAPQVIAQGLSRFANTSVLHEGDIEITAGTDRLRIEDTVMTSRGSSATMSGAGTLDLQTGSDWIINIDPEMAVTMTLDLNGGQITNVELLTFPGVVNANQFNVIENSAITIPSTTTFNYFDTRDILPSFAVINNGTFVIQSGVTSLNLEVQDGSAFVNNGTFQLAATTSLSLLSDFQNNGLLTLAAGTTLISETAATLFSAGSFSGSGDLTVNGGALDITAATTLPATMTLNLVSGSFINAQNLSVGGLFNWFDGSINGTGPGFTTAAQVNLNRGDLNTDWLISPTSTVDWVGSNNDLLVINNATITNQGTFLVSSSLGTGVKPAENVALKNFTASNSASFINQGRLLVSGNDAVVFDLTFNNDGGLIGIDAGSSFSLGTTTLTLDQTTDRLQGFGTFVGNVINSAGVVTPGKADQTINEIGTLTINGNYSQSATGTLVVKLDSTVQGLLNNDVLDVTGLLTAGGIIDFRVIDPTKIVQLASLIDQSFSPLKFNSFAGRFDQATIPTGLNFTLGANGLISVNPEPVEPVEPVDSVIKKSNDDASKLLQDLFENDGLNYDKVVESIKLTDKKVKLALRDDDEDDEEEDRAPRLVCK